MAFVAPTRQRIFRISLFSALLLAGALFPFQASLAHASVYVSNVQALFHFTSSTLTDSSGNAYNGTNNGATFNTTSSKLGGAAVSFNTTNDFQAPSSTFAMQDTDWTVGFWAYPRANFTVPAFVTRDVGSGGHPKQAISDNVTCVNGLEAASYPGSGSFRCYISDTGQHLSLNTWQWVLYEKQGSRYELYVNDVLKDTETNATAPETIDQPTQFNGFSEGTGTPYNYATWDMDEYFFASTYITTSTRDSLYNSGTGAEVCVTAGCDGGSTPTVSVTSGTLWQFQQYYSNVTSTLTRGSSTAQGNVWGSMGFGATVQSTGTSTIQLQVEVEPATTTFIGTPTSSSAYVSSGNGTTATIKNLSPGAYHWQARSNDGNNNTSTWQIFGPNATGTDFVVLAATSSAGGIELSDGSVQALYHFDSSDLTDSSGNRYNGTNNGATFNTTSSKLGGGAVSFNTTNDFQAPSSTWAMQATDSSVGFWVYPRANFSVPNFVSKDVGAQTNPKAALSDNVGCVNGLEAWEQDPNVCHLNSTGNHLSLNTWHWVLYEKQGTRWELYVDDNLKDTETNSNMSAIDQPAQFNGISEGTGAAYNYATWDMDEYFFLNKYLATSTRDSLYNSRNGVKVCTTAGCQHFLLNEELDVPSVHNAQILYNASTTYSDALAKAVNTWNAQSKISLASSTATSSDVLKISDTNRSDLDGFVDWSITAGMWRPKSFFASSTDNLILNTYLLSAYNSSTTQKVITHELGHSLGLAHSFTGNIMFTNPLDVDSSTTALGSQDTTDYSYLYP